MSEMSEHLKHLGKLLKEVSVKAIMKKPVRTVNVNEDFSRVEEIFVAYGIRHLPVVDGNHKLVGLITQKDVYRRVAPRRFIDGKVTYMNDRIIDEDGYYDKENLN